MAKILLTGCTGFVGGRVFSAPSMKAHEFVRVCRSPFGACGDFEVNQIDASTDWSKALIGVGVVVHCAARVHVMNETGQGSLAAFREVNVEGTTNLAKQAATSGVKRFIFISSIKVNGETTSKNPFKHSDQPNPQDAYAQSKHEAELALKQVCEDTGMDYVIIRPPLVYGPQVKANFFSMLKWVSRGVPLPLGAVTDNQRSIVFIDNLVSLISVCAVHDNARNQTFLVSDGQDVSTRALLEALAAAFGRKSRLLAVPLSWLGIAGRLLGKRDIEQRLASSLAVDISHTKDALAWAPPVSMAQGLKATADWFGSRS